MTRQQFIEQITAEQESLRRFLRGLCRGDGFLADDIAQEALLKAYLSFGSFEGRSRFSTWLFRIAYNCWHDHLKKDNRFETFDDEAVAEEVGLIPANKMRDDHEYQHLLEAISRLTPHEKTVILLYYMEDMSIKEIESITDMPSGTIRSCLSRGRKHLRDYLLKA